MSNCAQSTPNSPQTVTVLQVAKALRVTPKTVSRWCESGRLRAVRTLGGDQRRGHWRIPRVEFDRLRSEIARMPAAA